MIVLKHNFKNMFDDTIFGWGGTAGDRGPKTKPLGKGINNKMDNQMKIAIIGDFEPERLTHKATNAALRHAADKLSTALSTDWLSTPSLESGTAQLENYHGIMCAPGGPYESMSGALEAIRFARERGWPFFGT